MPKATSRKSAGKGIYLNVTRSTLAKIPSYFLTGLTILSFVIFGSILSLKLVNSTYTDKWAFEAFTVFILVLFNIQVARFVLFGFGAFREGLFDLVFLVTAIGLIMGLLIKQIFELEGATGMMPDTINWHYSIWGILSLMVFSYLLDNLLRVKRVLTGSLLYIMGTFGVLLGLNWLLYGQVGSFAYDLVFLSSAFVLVLVVKSQKSINLVLAYVALIILSVFMIFSTISDFIIVLFLVQLFFASLALSRLQKVKFRKEVMSILQKKKLPKFKTIRELGVAFLAIYSFVAGFFFVLINLINGKLSFFLLEEGAHDLVRAFKATGDFGELMIGANFFTSYDSYFANIYASYGILGFALIIFVIVSLFVFSYKLFKSAKQETRIVLIPLGITLFSMVLLMIFSDRSPVFMIVLFLIASILSNMARIGVGELIEDRRLKLGSSPIDLLWNSFRIVIPVAVFVLSIYMIANFEDIFESTI